MSVNINVPLKDFVETFRETKSTSHIVGNTKTLFYKVPIIWPRIWKLEKIILEDNFRPDHIETVPVGLIVKIDNTY